ALHDDRLRVGAEVFLGVAVEGAGKLEAVAAERPADDRRVPELHAAEVAEAPRQLRADAADARAVPAPEPGPGEPGPLDRRDDAVHRVVPGDRLPVVGAARTAPQQWLGQAQRVALDLVGGAAPHTEEAVAVGMVGVALEADELAVLNGGDH